MSDKFKPLADGFYVASQLTVEDIEDAKAIGIEMIICNRPDHEEPDQPLSAEIEHAAKAAGMSFVRIPIDQRGIAKVHIEHFKDAVGADTGPILAYCRSGTRSTMLRAFVRASEGDDINMIVRQASNAGYELYTMVPGLEAVSPNAGK